MFQLPQVNAVWSFGRTCLSVCLSVCNALTFKSLDLKVYVWYTSTSSKYLGKVYISRSSGQGQGHRSVKCVSISCSRVVCPQLKGNIVTFSYYYLQLIERFSVAVTANLNHSVC